MTEEEAINYLKAEGFDLFHVEEKPLKIIIAGCRNEQKDIEEKLNSIREKVE